MPSDKRVGLNLSTVIDAKMDWAELSKTEFGHISEDFSRYSGNYFKVKEGRKEGRNGRLRWQNR